MSNFSDDYIIFAKFTDVIHNIHYVKEYLNIEVNYNDDDNLLYILMDGSASYIRNYTQMEDYQLNEYHESVIVFLLLVSEFYNNRQVSMSKTCCSFT